MYLSKIPSCADHPDLGRTPAGPLDEAATIAIVDGDDVARRLTARLLESEGYRILPFASGDAFLMARLSQDDVTCVLLDARKPGSTGLDILRALAGSVSSPPVIVLTAHADIGMVVEAMKLRAADVIEKSCAPAILLGAVTRVEAAARKSAAARKLRRESAALLSRLTKRQQQVLHGIVRGQPNKIIAWELGLSVRTVEAYRAQLLERLRARNTADAVGIALSAGVDGREAFRSRPWAVGE